MTAQPRTALITGVTGQDGSFLTELLLAKGYQVWGLVRRTSDLQRIGSLSRHAGQNGGRFDVRPGDLSDSGSVQAVIAETQPDEVYHLAAQSHVHLSFDVPEYTGDITALGTLRLLEAIRKQSPQTRFFNAGSSEQFGKATETPQTENTRFYPRSPYACAKVYAFDITRNYRESYGMFAVSGIMFNHESPRRGETFVTRKITRAVAAVAERKQDCLSLGNLDAKRDWGYAGDYVDAMWRMLQADVPEDFVIATGQNHSVRQFCEVAFAHIGLPLRWQGSAVDEKGFGPDGQVLVQVDPSFFRPAEVDVVLGDSSKARDQLGWRPRVSFRQLVHMMVDADLAALGSSRPKKSTS